MVGSDGRVERTFDDRGRVGQGGDELLDGARGLAGLARPVGVRGCRGEPPFDLGAQGRTRLEECGEVTLHTNMAILSLVGADMRQMVGIAGRMFSVLGEAQINLEMISQGTSMHSSFFFPKSEKY